MTVQQLLENRKGKRIVFTNGVFDLLHAGHVQYLEEARSLGDALIVALNSDESVRQLKGPARPINTLDDRMRVIGALRCVDAVTSFSELTPEALIMRIRPDIHVKGGDYTVDQLAESKIVLGYGGEVRILPFLDGRSTTTIIERSQIK